MGVVEAADKIINNHHILIEASLCSRFRTPKSECALCADSCPAGAIDISEEGSEIKAGCMDCGVCISACPNGVFRMKERDDEKIIAEIREKSGKEKVFGISCQRGDNSADLMVPCLGRLSEAMLLEPIKAGVLNIEISRPECGGCPNSKASSNIDRIINNVSAVYGMAGIEKDRLIIKRIPLQPLSKMPEKAVSRREFFSAFRAKAAEVAVTSLPDVGTEEEKETFIGAIARKPENFKRKLLIYALDGFSSSKETNVPSTDAMLAELEVSSGCTGCGVCATLCPAGALTQKQEDGKFSLSFKPALCVNCRVCEETCLPKAVKIKETARLNYLLEDAEIKVFETERNACSVCGMDFVAATESLQISGEPGTNDICPLCVSRHKKQMAFIQNGFIKASA
ncbi:MAG: 4Fe-4S dicluster domain-containing protein [Nitrospirae bacterium]|nr:4Fe-4S dicluster domain-containing protein [Nitrospirota bacterium]MCL5976953.1 4Fe-4S dicluster domain-containing protein [Nitrospirota bacterium]